jgi:hypothetical protein
MNEANSILINKNLYNNIFPFKGLNFLVYIFPDSIKLSLLGAIALHFKNNLGIGSFLLSGSNLFISIPKCYLFLKYDSDVITCLTHFILLHYGGQCKNIETEDSYIIKFSNINLNNLDIFNLLNNL